MPNANRVGSVAWHRAQGTNKGAGGPGKSPSPSPSPRPSPSPSPRPRPTPSPSPRPSPSPSPSPTPTPTPSPSRGGGGGGAVNRVGSVAYNRAHGLNKGAGGPGKSGGSPQQQAVSRTNSFTNAQMAGNAGGAPGLVKARREAQKASGLSMKAYKAGVSAGTINKHGQAINGGNTGSNTGGTGAGAGAAGGVNANQALFDQYGQGLEGYANWYNDVGMGQSQQKYQDFVKENPDAYTSHMDWHHLEIGDNGLFNYNGNNVINGWSYDADMMKKFGIKGGDKIFDVSKSQGHIENGSVYDGSLNAHYYAAGLVMPTDTADSSHMKQHEAQMKRNQWKADASGTELGDSSGLYQDRYQVGYHGDDDLGVRDVGSDHHESINQAIQESGGDLRKGIDAYIRDGGYAGDALKLLDGKHKGNLTSSKDIKWYNSLISEAQNFDWEAENQSRAGDAGGYYDVRAGGMSNSSIQANKNWQQNQDAGYYQAGAMDPSEAAATFGQNAQDYSPQGANAYQDQQHQQQNNMNYDFSQFMPSQQQGSKFQPWTPSNSYFDPYRFQQGQ